ncbi:hypothetical protein B0T26DRAFT_680845 [Lasiosphaeria miniovina]|uniref:Uncharacterized protein n=1 Tax=Lasiosphaeria miniovina TaxID=1954250 RepID=A0AA39ZT80_9PEZI|nr:uncharacterized protein B0T26DRAFT_680845 [Lasiosphaeria miniovina]KAK0703103.1 hypothetical protein B0T26DRAFT_680845 [Lasiosphaeria miniovina]
MPLYSLQSQPRNALISFQTADCIKGGRLFFQPTTDRGEPFHQGRKVAYLEDGISGPTDFDKFLAATESHEAICPRESRFPFVGGFLELNYEPREVAPGLSRVVSNCNSPHKRLRVVQGWYDQRHDFTAMAEGDLVRMGCELESGCGKLRQWPEVLEQFQPKY